MPNLPGGTVIGEMTCPCCKGKVKVKLNKNGMAYYYCNNGMPSGDPCSHSQKWGRAASNAMQEAYLKHRKAADPAQEPAETPPKAKPPAARGSAFDLLSGV